MEKSIIECIGRQEGVDRNGKPYVRLFFRNWKFDQFFHPVTGESVYVQNHSVVGHINQYPESYTSSKRPDPHYKCQVGDFLTGEVVQRIVEPYTTEKGFTINYYNAVVFGDSTRSDWEDRIRQAFRKEGRTLLPDSTHTTFAVTAPTPKEVAKENDEVPVNAADRKKVVEMLKGKEEKINF
jgi:hypothetical protein